MLRASERPIHRQPRVSTRGENHTKADAPRRGAPVILSGIEYDTFTDAPLRGAAPHNIPGPRVKTRG